MSKVFKYYYDFISQPSRALWIGLRMSKTSFEDCPVAIRKRETQSDEFKKINRFRKVPCIVDGDLHIGESVAIVRYLSGKGEFSEELYPKDLLQRTRVDEFLSWQHISFRYPLTTYFVRLWALPMRGVAHPPSDKQEAKLRKDMEDALKIVEKLWLKDSAFLTGNKMTIADLFGACEVEQTRITKYDASKNFPKISDWLARVREESNPYFDEAHKYIPKFAAMNPKMKQ